MQLGAQYGRPPLLNWVVMLGVWLLGWDHILLAMRLIAFLSTLGMAAMVAWFAHYLSRDPLLAAFAMACFLTGDLLTSAAGWPMPIRSSLLRRRPPSSASGSPSIGAAQRS
jgi:hypothetical protein